MRNTARPDTVGSKFLQIQTEKFISAMPLSLLPSLMMAILLVGYTPGPANLFSLHCAMHNGVRKAFAMWLGLLAGFTIAAVTAALITHWIGTMMGRYVVILKYIGCAYIFYLAWQIFRSSGTAAGTDKTCTFLSGIIVQLTNAKIILFDLMAYTTFVLPYSTRLTDLLVVAVLLEIAGPGANLVYLLAGSKLHSLFTAHPRFLDRTMALLLAACAVYILLA